MYSVQNSMPLDSFSVIQPSTSQAEYSEGQICRFMLPRSLGFFDPANSFLELQVQLSGNNYPMTFSNDCGANMMIEFIKISQNGVQIEQIDRYNNLAQLKKCYSETFNERQRHSAKDLSRVNNSSQQNSFKVGNESNPTFAGRLGGLGDTSANFNKTTNVYLDLNLTGLFSHTSLVPLVAMGDVEIEIRFAKNSEVLIVDPNVKANHKVVGQIADGATSITLDKDYAGYLGLGDSPFAVGMEITPEDSDGTARTAVEISAIEEDENGTIVLTTGAITTGNTTATGNVIKITKGTNLNGGNKLASVDAGAKYIVNKANFYLNIVRPPSQYIDALSRQTSGQGLVMDLNSWTCYKNVIKKEIPSQTLEIPCYAMRSKAILTILNKMVQNNSYRVDNTADYNANGEIENLETYNYQDGNGNRFPTRPVDVSILNQSLRHPSAQHCHELSKALMSSSIPFNSFKRQVENFVVGRAFGRYGATSNLSTQGGLRIYLDYDDSSKPSVDLQSLSWCNHINRIVVRNDGLQVFS